MIALTLLVYILELSSALWGVCQSESSGGSFIKIRNSYQGMSDLCNDETNLLWLTIGHEFFHAIQYAYRSNFSDSYFRELTSMWFENIFVPECYDFLAFVDMSSSSLFNNPEKEFDDNTSGIHLIPGNQDSICYGWLFITRMLEGS